MHAVLHAMNDRAGAHEQQRLEEGVRDQVEQRRHPRAHAQRRDHEAQLRNRGVSQHFLHVTLRKSNRGGEERRERADDNHRREGDQFAVRHRAA